jgi:hypothetical protein
MPAAKLTPKERAVLSDLMREGGTEEMAKSILLARIDVAADWDALPRQRREAKMLKRIAAKLGWANEPWGSQ